MTGDKKWGTQLVRLVSLRTKEEEESHKICDIVWATKDSELKTDIIMGRIRDVILKQGMME